MANQDVLCATRIELQFASIRRRECLFRIDLLASMPIRSAKHGPAVMRADSCDAVMGRETGR